MIAVKSESPRSMTLRAKRAEDLMTADPLSIQETLTAQEALAIFIDKAISGAPVINAAGWPVGVLSERDLLVHDREGPPGRIGQGSAYTEAEEVTSAQSAPLPQREAGGHSAGRETNTLVRDMMTPAVFAVGRHTPAERVIEQMCGLNVHRLFVVDAAGVLVGVITPMDVLRQLTPNVP